MCSKQNHKILADATLLKTELLVEQNLLILMTTPDSQLTNSVAHQFMQIRREQKLEKLIDRREAEKLLKAQKLAAEEQLSSIQETERAETARQITERQAAVNADNADEEDDLSDG